MHERYEKDGLVCMSLSLDEPEERDKAFGFLKEKGARFQNFLLDEGPQRAQEQWDFQGVPTIVVYDRSGRIAGRFESYDGVEALVQKLLAQK